MSYSKHLTQDAEIWRLVDGLDAHGNPSSEYTLFATVKGLVRPLSQNISEDGRILADSKVYLMPSEILENDKINIGGNSYDIYKSYNVHYLSRQITVSAKRCNPIC